MGGLSVVFDGEEVFTGGVKGFLDIVTGALAKWRPAPGVYIAWEGGGRKTRQLLLPEYKVREPDPRRDELWERIKPQYGLLEAILGQTGWTQIRAPGWEADDAMATLAQAASSAGLDSVILSGDADMLQCLSDSREGDERGSIRVMAPNQGGYREWTEAGLFAEHGITPAQMADVKALAGDSSDCYRGAPGIGMSWACRLVAEHGGLQQVIQAAKAGKLTNAKASSVLADVPYLQQCYKVAQINARTRTKSLPGRADEAALRGFLKKLRMSSYLNTPSKLRMLL
jgi:5'-3' exonuclease